MNIWSCKTSWLGVCRNIQNFWVQDEGGFATHAICDVSLKLYFSPRRSCLNPNFQDQLRQMWFLYLLLIVTLSARKVCFYSLSVKFSSQDESNMNKLEVCCCRKPDLQESCRNVSENCFVLANIDLFTSDELTLWQQTSAYGSRAFRHDHRLQRVFPYDQARGNVQRERGGALSRQDYKLSRLQPWNASRYRS